jgi:hypothetical protein
LIYANGGQKQGLRVLERGRPNGAAFGVAGAAIGIGEAADDLQPFEARAYAKSLVGLDG